MAEEFEDEMEQTVTIEEYIEGVEAEELEADLVLGGDDGKECTYDNGYMKRQAIFSCLTCVPDGNAGICTACSLSCHDGHEVIELWTKRKFRCDCGNSKFGEISCKLCPSKESENVDNGYNQNFKGRYCICARPYPDPAAQEQVEMIQCCICEDWFHGNHLGLASTEEIPVDKEGEPLYDDFICQNCAIVCSFLKIYPPSIWSIENQKKESELSDKGKVHEFGASASTNIEIIDNVKLISGEQTNGDARSQGSECIIGLDISCGSFEMDKKPFFLLKKWRDNLCRCFTCTNFYIQKGLNFLIDKEDTLEEYEKIARQKREEKLQQEEGAEMNFLDKLNHVQKIEFLRGISDLKDELHSFLESFDTSKPITSADVKGLFENLAKKRQRLS